MYARSTDKPNFDDIIYSEMNVFVCFLPLHLIKSQQKWTFHLVGAKLNRSPLLCITAFFSSLFLCVFFAYMYLYMDIKRAFPDLRPVFAFQPESAK